MNKKDLLMIKIGGGVITDKKVRYKMREGVVERLAREIKEGWQAIKEKVDVVLGNGAGSFGHFSARRYGTKNGFNDEWGAVGAGWVRWDAVKLNQIVVEALLREGVPAFSLAPSSMMVVKGERVQKVEGGSLVTALEKGLVAVVYGDVMVDEKQGSTIFSTERVFEVLWERVLKERYERIRVIHVGVEEGVRGRQGIVKVISKNNWQEVKEYLGGSEGVDVTGGMLHKVKMCLRLAEEGAESWIIGGLKKGRLKRLMMGEKVEGTLVKC